MVQVPASPADLKAMAGSISAYCVLIVLGVCGALLNFPLIYTLVRSAKLRADSKLLITLAFGDTINCLALCLTGVYRYELYAHALESGLVPVETSRTCAKMLHMWLR